ncbi:MAG TPA: ABC transporter ATP-binding protein [Actinomycetota bacterium]|nr:ABC transporter ATP-binding protein [Actinomycetota bacterium]
MEQRRAEPAERTSAQQLLDRSAVVAVDVVKIYGEGEAAVRALDGVSLVVPKGRFKAIMGPSGSGKSTLLHCLAALDDVTSGKVFVGGVEVSGLDEKQRTRLRRDKVGFIFQAFNLVPTLDALENVTLPMNLAGRPVDRKWLDYLIDTVGLKDRLHHLPAELSGGQQQRVAAARALASRPDIVFADEPTGNLDSRRGQELLQFLRRTVDEFSQTIVMVTHDAFAASYADSVVFLADGRIVEELENPKTDEILDFVKTLEG